MFIIEVLKMYWRLKDEFSGRAKDFLSLGKSFSQLGAKTKLSEFDKLSVMIRNNLFASKATPPINEKYIYIYVLEVWKSRNYD